MVTRFFTDLRMNYESDILDELRLVICDGTFREATWKKASELIEELERRAHLREMGHDMDADIVAEH